MRFGPTLCVATLLLAGCAQPAPGPAPPAGEYLADESGDAPPRFDILAANLTELSGSLAIRLQVHNFNATNGGLPFLEARVTTADGATHYARTFNPPCSPGSQLPCGEAGRIEDDRHVDAYTTCWFPSLPANPSSPGPWWLLIEVLHNRTGLTQGGTVGALRVQTLDHNGTVQDEAEATRDLPVAGGPNPYLGRAPDCPLMNERDRVT